MQRLFGNWVESRTQPENNMFISNDGILSQRPEPPEPSNAMPN